MENQKNTQLVKQIDGTPFTLITTEKDGVIITIGRTIIQKYYENHEEAETHIRQMTNKHPLLLNTIMAIAKTIYDNNEEITKLSKDETITINTNN